MNYTEEMAESDVMRRFMRLHSHDFRNHFNGIEMELMLMEATSDTAAIEGIERIRKEVSAMETGLRYLENRFADPEREFVSALDVFNQWQSRYSVIGDTEVIWNCGFRNVSIHVDMCMISDTLCEWLMSMKRAILEEVTGEIFENEVCFSVKLKQTRAEQNSPVESLPPGFSELIEGNGGRYQKVTSHEGRIIGGRCRFPIVMADES